MVHVQRIFTVDKPVEQVVAYVADFANAEAWDPGTQSCTRVGSGPATSTDDITVTEHPDGAEVVYDSTVELTGAAELAAPVTKIELERLGDETVKGITSAIGSL